MWWGKAQIEDDDAVNEPYAKEIEVIVYSHKEEAEDEDDLCHNEKENEENHEECTSDDNSDNQRKMMTMTPKLIKKNCVNHCDTYLDMLIIVQI